MKSIKVAVTGAAGQIGYAFLFRLASGEVFGPETELHLTLLELESAIPALRGVVMELEDGAFPLLRSLQFGSDQREAFADADWAILIGSVPRQAGMERGDLLKVNGKIFVEQGKILGQVAKASCHVLVVGNPCNTNAYIVKQVAKRLSERNIFALMMLDQLRAQAQLAQKAGTDVSKVSQLAVWGNHSSTQYPNYRLATIDGRPLMNVITDNTWLEQDFLTTVQQRGAAIIKARGKSSAASAANAVIQTIRALTTPTPKGEFFSVAVCSDGSYGISPGLMFGFPVRSDGANWSIVDDLSIGPYSQEQISVTERELINERAIVMETL